MNEKTHVPVDLPTREYKPRMIVAALLPFAAYAIYVASVWSRLPTRLAVQFGLDGAPTRFLTKNEFVAATLVFLVIELVVMLGAAISARKNLARLVFVLVVVELMLLAAVVHHNLGGASSTVVQLGVLALALGLAAAVVALPGGEDRRQPGLQRNPASSGSPIIGEFRHRSVVVALGVLPLLAYQIWVWRTPGAFSKLIAAGVGLIVLWVAVLAWRGFRYLVRRDGLLVQGLVRTIVFVPPEEIRRVEVATVNALDVGGWGSRGRGRRRAFIWRSGPGVRVEIEGGALFLASDEAASVAAALESMRSMGTAESR
jgi:hypothetical protein